MSNYLRVLGEFLLDCMTAEDEAIAVPSKPKGATVSTCNLASKSSVKNQHNIVTFMVS